MTPAERWRAIHHSARMDALVGLEECARELRSAADRAEACDDTDRAEYLRACAEADETLVALAAEADDDG